LLTKELSKPQTVDIQMQPQHRASSKSTCLCNGRRVWSESDTATVGREQWALSL